MTATPVTSHDSYLLRNLAIQVRRHRLEADLSQERFAFTLGFHRTFIGGIERAERNITLLTLEDLARRMGVDPLDLLQP